jgi:hypothetical protein
MDLERESAMSEAVQEAYAFVCLSCGHGWEQAYEIEHRTTPDGRVVCDYHANGVRVPSPLTHPSCPGCGGAHLRIMGAGRVANLDSLSHAARPGGAWQERADRAREAHERERELARHSPAARHHRLHLPFHFRLRREG